MSVSIYHITTLSSRFLTSLRSHQPEHALHVGLLGLRYTMSPSTAARRLILLADRVLQWSSAVIVMGLNSYFISKRRHANIGEHITYVEVIVCVGMTSLYLGNMTLIIDHPPLLQSTMSVVFFLPAFFSPFMPSVLSKLVMTIDIIFSYL